VDPREEQVRKAEQAADEVRGRLGRDAVTRARLIRGPREREPEDAGKETSGPSRDADRD
jgi:hypothetical protein